MLLSVAHRSSAKGLRHEELCGHDARSEQRRHAHSLHQQGRRHADAAHQWLGGLRRRLGLARGPARRERATRRANAQRGPVDHARSLLRRRPTPSMGTAPSPACGRREISEDALAVARAVARLRARRRWTSSAGPSAASSRRSSAASRRPRCGGPCSRRPLPAATTWPLDLAGLFDVFDDWADDDTREGEAARRRAAAAAFVHASAGALGRAQCRRAQGRRVELRSSASAAPRPRSAARRRAPWPPSRTARGFLIKRYLVLHGDVDPGRRRGARGAARRARRGAAPPPGGRGPPRVGAGARRP